jgi:hypothetical protein
VRESKKSAFTPAVPAQPLAVKTVGQPVAVMRNIKELPKAVEQPAKPVSESGHKKHAARPEQKAEGVRHEGDK